jgi:hypothetical protein
MLMDVKMTDDATHQPVLFELIRWTRGAIIELGAGVSSTEQIHRLAPDRKILTVDDNQTWLNNYKHLKTDRHEFALFSENLFEVYGREWAIALIDLTTWDQRMWAIEKLRYFVDYIIIHDVQGKGLGKLFEFWREYRVNDFPMPTTLLASNIYPLEDIYIEGATIVNS